MSQDVRDFEKSFNSTNDLSAVPFTVVGADTSNDSAVVAATSATAAVVGVLRNKPKAGQAALVRMSGTSKVTAGGTIAAGDRVTPTTGGKVITTTSAGNTVVGIALAAAVTGDIFEIMLTPGAKY